MSLNRASDMIPKLTPMSYHEWALAMEDYLGSQGMKQYFTEHAVDYDDEGNFDESNYTKGFMNGWDKCFSHISLSMGSERKVRQKFQQQAKHAMEARDPHALWIFIKDHFISKSAVVAEQIMRALRTDRRLP